MQRFLIFITAPGTLWGLLVRMPEDRAGGAPVPALTVRTNRAQAGTVPLQLSFGVVEQRIVDTDDPYDDTIPKTRVVNGRPHNVNLYIFNETAEYAYHAYLTKSSSPPTVAVPRGCVPDLLHRQSGVRHGGTVTPAQLTQSPLPGGRS